MKRSGYSMNFLQASPLTRKSWKIVLPPRVGEAIRKYGIDPEKRNPVTV